MPGGHKPRCPQRNPVATCAANWLAHTNPGLLTASRHVRVIGCLRRGGFQGAFGISSNGTVAWRMRRRFHV